MNPAQIVHRQPSRPVVEAHVTVSSSTYTAKAGDRVIGVNYAGAATITLPTSQNHSGRSYTIKDESGAAAANNISVATEGVETIDGAATDTISENYGSKTYYSDGSNWFIVPLLAVSSHTLASHSTKAHPDLTGVGTGDHHAQTHQADHNSGAGDALKLDDLAAPDDNTDLDYSTTAHGLVPKGTNVGNFLKDDGTWGAAGGGADISARVYNSAAQSISNSTETTVTFDTEYFDTDTIHSTSSNTGRLTATTDGVYIIVFNFAFTTNATGHRKIIMKLNGSTEIAIFEVDTNQNDEQIGQVSTVYKLSATDYVEVIVWQNSGGALNLKSAVSSYSANFGMAKVLGS